MEHKGRETIGRFIAMLHRMAMVYLGQELPALKLGAGQYIFLAELFDEPGQSQDDLTRQAYVDKANTARALDKLESLGYVRRVADDQDKRKKRAYPQPAAWAIQDEFWLILTKWSETITRGIPPERQEQMLADLKTMVDNADEYLQRYG